MKISGFFRGKNHDSTKKQQESKPLIPPLKDWYPWLRKGLNWVIIFTSALICLLMSPTRFLGTELLGIAPNWPLIWLVAWSVKRPTIAGAFAGIIVGLLQDALTAPHPSHAFSLAIVGILTSRLQKQRFIKEDFISIALIVFIMVLISNTVFVVQLFFTNNSCKPNCFQMIQDVRIYYQRSTLSSAILSSLWAPVVYYPLNHWWQKIIKLTRN
ncbi:rod shape-determining protein MreD [Raphidiopsis curvata NIES-932]|nr:rod shape-determining protein MreD [Raphidiopsis curvata NIES-932]